MVVSPSRRLIIFGLVSRDISWLKDITPERMLNGASMIIGI